MFHRLTLYGHENKRVYREVENRQTDRDGGIGACCLCRIQLSVFTGNIPRMGSGSHCLLRGFFGFLYKIACLLVAAAILFCILSYLVF